MAKKESLLKNIDFLELFDMGVYNLKTQELKFTQCKSNRVGFTTTENIHYYYEKIHTLSKIRLNMNFIKFEKRSCNF